MTWLLLRWKNRKILIRFLEFPSVKFLIGREVIPYYLLSIFRSVKKHRNAKNEKKLPWQPLLFSILKVSSCQTTPVLSISENLPKEIEENWNQSQTDVKKWRCLSSFNLRLKALISEVTVEQQILALVCYVSVALIRKIAKRTKILRRNPPDVGVTSGQKPSTKIIYIVLQTSVGLF